MGVFEGVVFFFFYEQGAFSVKYSFDTEIEINPLSNPYFEIGSICQLHKKSFLGFELFNSF